MRMLVTAALIALVAFLAYDFVSEYRAAVGSAWERAIAAGKGSATILWARLTMLVAALSDLLTQAADWLNAPGVADGIRSVLKPEYVAVFVVGLALVTELARRRSLNRD